MHSCRYLDCHVMPDQEVALCSLSVKAHWHFRSQTKEKKNLRLHICNNSCYDSYVALQRLKVALFFCFSLLFTRVCTYSLLAKRIEESKTAKNFLSVQQCCREILFKPQPDKWMNKKKSGFFCIYFFPIWEYANNTRSAKRHFVLVNEDECGKMSKWVAGGCKCR